jgi:hypothetical protein
MVIPNVYKRPATARIPPARAPIAGRAVGCEPPVEVEAAEAAERALLAALLADARMEDWAAAMLEDALGPALAATLLKLARRDETSPATEDWTDEAELWAEATREEAAEAAELMAELAADVAEDKAEGPAPTAEETWLRMDEMST